jgi:hypothetical protein
VHKEFRRFDIVVGAVFIILVIIGVVTVGNSSKPAANSSHVTRATTAAGPASAPAVVHSGTLAPPVTPSMPPPSPSAKRLGALATAPPTTAPAAPGPDKAVRARTAPAEPPSTRPAPPPSTAPPVQAAPAALAGCTPKTDAGNCYEPGEFCRDSAHGASGVAGDGKAIRCEDNDGWRWEPA